ncbi:hypothetical protein ACJJTC_008584 [Scirpophaga incertulas]
MGKQNGVAPRSTRKRSAVHFYHCCGEKRECARETIALLSAPPVTDRQHRMCNSSAGQMNASDKSMRRGRGAISAEYFYDISHICRDINKHYYDIIMSLACTCVHACPAVRPLLGANICASCSQVQLDHAMQARDCNVNGVACVMIMLEVRVRHQNRDVTSHREGNGGGVIHSSNRVREVRGRILMRARTLALPVNV